MLFGYSSIVNGSTAIIFFVLSKPLARLIGGTMNGMALSCFLWFIRFLALSYMENPQYVLLTRYSVPILPAIAENWPNSTLQTCLKICNIDTPDDEFRYLRTFSLQCVLQQIHSTTFSQKYQN